MRQELKDIEKFMADAVAALKERFKTLRTGRASLGMLDGITVSAYGTDVPLNQVANLSVPEPTLILAAPWDPKMAVEIERAIRKSELGLNPQNDGKIVRVPIPALTEERRKDRRNAAPRSRASGCRRSLPSRRQPGAQAQSGQRPCRTTSCAPTW